MQNQNSPFNKIINILLAPAKYCLKLMDGWTLEVNKVAGAILFAGVIAMSGAILSGILYGADHGGKHEEKRGYTIAGAEAFAEGASGGAAAPAVDAGPVDIAPFLAKADMAAGQALVKKCTACHTFDKGGKNGVGPNNYGVVGAKHAHVDGYNYSEALKAKHSEKWDFQALSDFLANPKKAIPGNKMAFAGIKDPQERANLIAYLNSQSDAPLALPK